MTEEVEQLESSPSEEVSEETIEDVKTEEAEQSSGSDGEDRESESLLDVVTAAYEQNKESESPADDEEEEGDSDDEEELEDSESEDDEDDFENVPFHKHPRFKKLIKQRNEYKNAAKKYQQIQTFMNQNSLDANEVVQGFQILGLMKKDPTKAHEVLSGVLERLASDSGLRLSEDLRERVDQGYLDEDSALELSRTRAQLHRQQEIEQQRVNQRNQQQLNEIRQSIADYEDRLKKSDPDYDLKAAEIDDRARILVQQNGVPSSVSEALALAKRAYEDVSDRHRKRFQTQKKPVRATQGRISGSTSPQPKSMLDVIGNVLNR
jgi:hypothetical protein